MASPRRANSSLAKRRLIAEGIIVVRFPRNARGSILGAVYRAESQISSKQLHLHLTSPAQCQRGGAFATVVEAKRRRSQLRPLAPTAGFERSCKTSPYHA